MDTFDSAVAPDLVPAGYPPAVTVVARVTITLLSDGTFGHTFDVGSPEVGRDLARRLATEVAG